MRIKRYLHSVKSNDFDKTYSKKCNKMPCMMQKSNHSNSSYGRDSFKRLFGVAISQTQAVRYGQIYKTQLKLVRLKTNASCRTLL